MTAGPPADYSAQASPERPTTKGTGPTAPPEPPTTGEQVSRASAPAGIPSGGALTGTATTAPPPAPDSATPKPTAAEEEASPPWSGYAQAQSMAENGNPRGALKQLETRLSTHPEDSRAAYLKGLVLMQLGRGDEAERWYKMMQANFPDLPQPGNALAVIYAGRGDLPAAEAALRALLEKHPDHTSARVNLARLYVQMAQAEYEKALKATPDNAMIARKLEALKAMQ